MTAKIYDFEEERAKRHTDDTGYGFGDDDDETVYGIYMKMTVEEFERLNEYKPLSVEGMHRLLENLGANTHND